MLITFAVEMPVEAFLAARGRVPIPRPERCPACGHDRLTFADWWTRATSRGPVDIHRAACAGCVATHSCWPDALVGRRVDLADMIGAALLAAARGAGHRPIAARLGVPAGACAAVCAASARSPVPHARRFRTLAGRLGTRLLAFAAAADPGIPHPPAGTPLAVAVGAVGAVAAALAGLSGEPVRPWPLAVRIAGGLLLG